MNGSPRSKRWAHPATHMPGPRGAHRAGRGGAFGDRDHAVAIDGGYRVVCGLAPPEIARLGRGTLDGVVAPAPREMRREALGGFWIEVGVGLIGAPVDAGQPNSVNRIGFDCGTHAVGVALSTPSGRLKFGSNHQARRPLGRNTHDFYAAPSASRQASFRHLVEGDAIDFTRRVCQLQILTASATRSTTISKVARDCAHSVDPP